LNGIEEDGMVTVALLDFGRTIRRNHMEIYTLGDRFRKLKWQGILCELAHLKSTSGGSWSLRAKKTIKILIEKQEGWVNILGTSNDEAALVELRMRSRTGNEINIREIMISLGHGEHCTDYRLLPIVEVPMSHEDPWTATTQKRVSNKPRKQKRINQYLRDELRCVTPLGGRPIYMNTHNLALFCSNCYQSMPIDQKLKNVAITPHNLVHKKSVDNRDRCTTCNETMVDVKSTSSCNGCIKGYRPAYKKRLDQGWGIAITTTPDDNDNRRGDPSNCQEEDDFNLLYCVNI